MDTDALIAHVLEQPREVVRRRNLAILDSPPLFDVEVASACNIVCSFCPRDAMVRRSGLMSEETFRAVLELLPVGAVAMLSGLGDALLHPELPDYVRRLVARGVSTCVITNGVRLTPAAQDALIDAGIAEIQVSVHGLDEAVVRRVIPVRAEPTLVREQVERLAARGGPRLRINFVETPDNVDQRARVEAWARGLGARFFHRRQHTRGGQVGSTRVDRTCSGCGIFAAVTFISSDGDILPCVNDVTGSGAFAHVRDTTWADVQAWKRDVISSDRWFGACRDCDDDYRWVLLAWGALEDGSIPSPTASGSQS